MQRYTHTHTHKKMNTVGCVAEGPSHALLWLYKESVFRVLQCGEAWHSSVKLPVKPTETGKGHRQQHTWVSLCFPLCVCVLSVWLFEGYVCPYLFIFGNDTVWNSTLAGTHGTALSPPLISPPISVCVHTLNIQTNKFSATTHTHACSTFQQSHMVPVLTRSLSTVQNQK